MSSWIASLDLQTTKGLWVTISAVHGNRLKAWKWLEKLQWKAYRRGIPMRGANVKAWRIPRQDAGQFEFLRGNEECAREWQDDGP